MHVLDFFHVIFVLCCNHSEAFKMSMGQPVSPFPLDIVFMVKNVDSQVYVLIKKDITFCTSGFKVGKSASETKLQKWPTPALSSTWRTSFVCSSIISLSRAARLSGHPHGRGFQ